MLELSNLPWLNINGLRKYPLADDASATDTTDTFTIPDDFILELDLPIQAGTDVTPGRFFVLYLGAYSQGYSITVGYQPADGDAVEVATASVNRATHTKGKVYALGGVAPFQDTVGKVVIGRLDNIDQQPGGFFTFALDASRIEPDCVRPMIRGVTSLVAVNGDQRSDPLQGVIQLVAGSNMQIVTVVQDGQDPIIRFNAVEGEGTVEDCACEGDAAATDPIKKINGISPTADGTFYLAGSDCIQLETIPNGLRVVDVCAKPCCGCAELERITQDLERLGGQAAAVEDFVDRLRAATDAMSLTVLGAKLGDRTCT
jgi:hypothetical protein